MKGVEFSRISPHMQPIRSKDLCTQEIENSLTCQCGRRHIEVIKLIVVETWVETRFVAGIETWIYAAIEMGIESVLEIGIEKKD